MKCLSTEMGEFHPFWGKWVESKVYYWRRYREIDFSYP